MAGHSPGPWHIEQQYPDGVAGARWLIIAANGQHVAETFRSAPRSAANVRLASAAPDLLHACITAVEVLQPMLSPCESDCECVLHLLDAAIAKAQGAA